MCHARRHLISASLILVILFSSVRLDAQSGRPTEVIQQQAITGTGSSAAITRFATEDFFAGVYLNLDKLVDNPRYQNFPLDLVFPSLILLDRFEPESVSEIAVFLKVDSDPSRDKTERFEVAAAGRLKQPIDLKTLIIRWQSSQTGQPEFEFNTDTIQIDNWTCYRVPSGTFLTPRRKYGELGFIDRNGDPQVEGYSVGNMSSRQYIDGETKSRAVFTFENITDADLIDGKLSVALRPAVYRARYLEQEYCQAQLFLRRTDGKLTSTPITFDVKSWKSHKIEFPAVISAVDASGEERQVDLVSDLVLGGKLEIVLKSQEEANYVGVNRKDLNITSTAVEYVAVNGDEIVVAQSLDRLTQMLNSTGTSELSTRMSQEDREIVFSANIRIESQRNSLNDFLKVISVDERISIPEETSFILNGRVTPNDPVIARLVFDTFDTRTSNQLNQQIANYLDDSRTRAMKSTGQFAAVYDGTAALMSMGTREKPFVFPETDVNRGELYIQLRNIINGLYDGITLDQDDYSVTIKVESPAFLAGQTKLEQYALAMFDAKRAREFLDEERFNEGAMLLGRITLRFPNSQAAWFRRASEMINNISYEMDGYESKYEWIRRGIHVYLDGADQNPEATDIIWMMRNYVGTKIGLADEQEHFRELFSTDTELHRRLSKYVELDNARSAEGKVDNWLVADLLYQYCIDKQIASDRTSVFSPLTIRLRPARDEALIAQNLDAVGKFDEALERWASAELLFETAGKKAIQLDESTTVELFDAERQLAMLDQADPASELAVWAYKSYQSAIESVRIEQLDETRNIRKLQYEAQKLYRNEQSNESFELYRKAMFAIRELLATHPDELDGNLDMFSEIIRQYEIRAERLEIEIDPWLRFLLD